MTTSRENVEKLLDLLADKSLKFGCILNYGGFTNTIAISDKQEILQNILGEGHTLRNIQESSMKIIGRPVLIGDVLQKIDEVRGGMNYYVGGTTYSEELIRRWAQCGVLTLSLNEVAESSGYFVYTDIEKFECTECTLRDPHARALFEYLFTIFL